MLARAHDVLCSHLEHAEHGQITYRPHHVRADRPFDAVPKNFIAKPTNRKEHEACDACAVPQAQHGQENIPARAVTQGGGAKTLRFHLAPQTSVTLS